MAGHHDDVGGAGFEERVELVDVVGADGDGALDLCGVAPDLGAPVVEHGVLVGERLGRTERIPRVGVLGGELQGHRCRDTCEREEVVPRPDRIDTDRLGPPPCITKLDIRSGLRMELDTDVEGHGVK